MNGKGAQTGDTSSSACTASQSDALQWRERARIATCVALVLAVRLRVRRICMYVYECHVIETRRML